MHLFFDFSNTKNKFVKKAFSTQKPMVLIIFDSELIKPNNWDIKNHKYFEIIFTWNDKLVDNYKYFKINFPNIIPNSIDRDLNNKIMYSDSRQQTQ